MLEIDECFLEGFAGDVGGDAGFAPADGAIGELDAQEGVGESVVLAGGDAERGMEGGLEDEGFGLLDSEGGGGRLPGFHGVGALFTRRGPRVV
ncbi:MAG: hypothetical protein RI897_3716 [Verrucomicrobiota bacterium]